MSIQPIIRHCDSVVTTSLITSCDNVSNSIFYKAVDKPIKSSCKNYFGLIKGSFRDLQSKHKYSFLKRNKKATKNCLNRPGTYKIKITPTLFLGELLATPKITLLWILDKWSKLVSKYRHENMFCIKTLKRESLKSNYKRLLNYQIFN